MATREKSPHFGYNYTSGIMLHDINRWVVVSPNQDSTKTIRLSIHNSTEVVAIVTIVIRITIHDGVG